MIVTIEEPTPRVVTCTRGHGERNDSPAAACRNLISDGVQCTQRGMIMVLTYVYVTYTFMYVRFEYSKKLNTSSSGCFKTTKNRKKKNDLAIGGFGTANS